MADNQVANKNDDTSAIGSLCSNCYSTDEGDWDNQAMHPNHPFRSTSAKPGCTHTSMDVIRSNSRCDACHRYPNLGWLYVCVQDDTEDRFIENERRRLVANEADPPLVIELKALGFSDSVINQAQAGVYSTEQLQELKAQKANVNALIFRETGKSIAHSPASDAVTFGHSFTNENANPQPNGEQAASDHPNVTVRKRKTSNAIKGNRDEKAASAPAKCTFKSCHACRPYYADRMYGSINTIVNEGPPAILRLWDRVKLIPAPLIRQLGLKRKPDNGSHEHQSSSAETDATTSTESANIIMGELVRKSTAGLKATEESYQEMRDSPADPRNAAFSPTRKSFDSVDNMNIGILIGKAASESNGNNIPPLRSMKQAAGIDSIRSPRSILVNSAIGIASNESQDALGALNRRTKSAPGPKVHRWKDVIASTFQRKPKKIISVHEEVPFNGTPTSLRFDPIAAPHVTINGPITVRDYHTRAAFRRVKKNKDTTASTLTTAATTTSVGGDSLATEHHVSETEVVRDVDRSTVHGDDASKGSEVHSDGGFSLTEDAIEEGISNIITQI